MQPWSPRTMPGEQLRIQKLKDICPLAVIRDSSTRIDHLSPITFSIHADR